MIIQNKGYASGLALGRRGVSKVSRRWLRGFLLYDNLLLVLLDHLLVLPLSGGRLTHSLHACNDDATLIILATTALKLRIPLLSY